MLQKAIERKKHYEDLGQENNVVLENLKVMKHSQIPNAYFIQVRYLIGEGGIFKENEILEGLNENQEWIDIKKDLKEVEYDSFLKDCVVCNF